MDLRISLVSRSHSFYLISCVWSLLFIVYKRSIKFDTNLAERPKSKDGEPIVYRLKDWPSGEEFMALMPSRLRLFFFILNFFSGINLISE